MKTKYKLVCFDVDGTLISDDNGSYWEMLHEEFEGPNGVRVNHERLEKMKRGEISYKELVDADMLGFQMKGTRRDKFLMVAKRTELNPGAREAVQALHEAGLKLGVISGTLSILVDALFPDHPFDDVYTNKVFFDKGDHLNKWEVTPFDFGTKHKALHAICKREKIPLSETVFIGDHVNDIDVLKEAGLGIAFCPKTQEVADAADVIITKRDLREMIPHILKQ